MVNEAIELLSGVAGGDGGYRFLGTGRSPLAPPASMEALRAGPMLPNPFCPFTAARIVALRATVLLLLTLLIKAKVRITAFSALGLVLLTLQTLLFLAAGGALTLVAGAAVLYATQQRRTVGA